MLSRVELRDAQDATQARVGRLLPHPPRVHLDPGVSVDRDDGRLHRPQRADRLANRDPGNPAYRPR